MKNESLVEFDVTYHGTQIPETVTVKESGLSAAIKEIMADGGFIHFQSVRVVPSGRAVATGGLVAC